MNSRMKILIGADHAGYKLKEELKEYIKQLGHNIKDYGADSEEAVDYPLIAGKLAKDAVKNKARGILICGSGIGMSIAANKVKGARAAVCHNEFTAEVSRTHNNSNILCLGSRDIEKGIAKKIVKIWLETRFSDEERHKRRVDEISKIEC